MDYRKVVISKTVPMREEIGKYLITYLSKKLFDLRAKLFSFNSKHQQNNEFQ